MSFGAHIPFVDELGFSLLRFEPGHATLGYTPRPEHLNSFAVVHGGAVMTLLDVGMASAARSVQPEMGAITIEMKTSFMRAAPGNGSPLTCQARLLHRTAKMVFTEGHIYDAQGNLCAHATGTFKLMARTSHTADIPSD